MNLVAKSIKFNLEIGLPKVTKAGRGEKISPAQAANLAADAVNWTYMEVEDQFKSGSYMHMSGEMVGKEFALKLQRRLMNMGYDARVTSKLYTKGITHKKARYSESVIPWTNFSER